MAASALLEGRILNKYLLSLGIIPDEYTMQSVVFEEPAIPESLGF
jgi:hypothetical protein